MVFGKFSRIWLLGIWDVVEGLARIQHEATRPAASSFNLNQPTAMLRWALIFLLVAIVAAIFGFTGIAGAATEIARVLFFIFLVLLVIAALVGAFRGKPPV